MKNALHRPTPVAFVAAAIAAVIVSCRMPTPSGDPDPQNEEDPMTDPYLWLEDVEDEQALAWVRGQNAAATNELAGTASFQALQERLLSIYDSSDRIPMPRKLGDWLYNFWRDETHVRGILRRTTLGEYRKPAPVWETVLDLDRLAAEEGENWVWQGYAPLYPEYDRCLVYLSRGGGDAKVVREFDLLSGQFVPGGFVVAEGKTNAAWIDRDALYVGTDFGPGSLTDSGYPRTVRRWVRGAALRDAEPVFAGEQSDVSAQAMVVHDRGHTYHLLVRRVTFYTDEVFLWRDGAWLRLAKPDDAEAETFGGHLLLTLRSDWEVGGRILPAGALVASDLEAFLAGNRDLDVLFAPTPTTSLAGVSGTYRHLIVNELEDVRNCLTVLTPGLMGWERTPLEPPCPGTVSAWGVDPDASDQYWLTADGFLNPSTLYLGTVGAEPAEPLKQLPAFFDAAGLTEEQHFALSRDGTRVPYFQVGPDGLSLTGDHPTLLGGYGGFEISLLPGYGATIGAAWLEKGYVYAVANLRGGGEYGPAWHQAALRENRQRAYDDFIAVAEDLVRRGVTRPERLGISGGSNGGLLMGNMLVQRPELFGAVVCQVPLLDMRRYHLLLAGASWMGEYGNPDLPEDWAFLRRYSPYHRVRADAAYPRVLFTTSTRDDRVHPGHARKMAARMEAQGHDVLYYENIEGGHGGAANNSQAAFLQALAFTFLEQQLARPPE
jgi:prolyl oligopeptidase